MPIPQIDPRELLGLYQGGAYDRLSERFLAVLEFFRANTFVSLGPADQYALDVFTTTFLYLFCRPDYVIAERYVPRLIALHVTVSNLVAMSSLGTADPFLRILEGQPQNYVKYLVLCSARNELRVDRKTLFNTSPALASRWYSYYTHLYRSGNADARAIANLREHFEYDDPRLDQWYGLAEPYFGATYVDPVVDRVVRQRINRWVRESPLVQTLRISNRPNPRSIAVITSFWVPQHSSYRILSQFVEALRDAYELTLVSLGPEITAPTAAFREVKRAAIGADGSPQFQSLLENDFQVALFLDVGMSALSVALSNVRLAPIQICGLGQSVSTFGSQIDYFLSGTEVELADEAARNYSERLVLIPGSGAIHNKPDYRPRGQTDPEGRLLVNCSWYAHKTNPHMLGLLQRIADRCVRPVVFRFFPGHSLDRENHLGAFVRTIQRVMGPRGEVVPSLPYADYMGRLEEGAFSIDCFPFGGCNTVADSLVVGRPMVTYEGAKWYNRIGSHMMRSVGLGELVARCDEEYVATVVRLIDDDDYRRDVNRRLAEVDLDRTIFNAEARQHVPRAIAYLIANHDQLCRDAEKTPITIG